MRHVTLCHGVIIDPKTGAFNASSPDELALLSGAKQLGFRYASKDENAVIELEISGVGRETYKLINTLEFSSARKRMSVIVQREEIYWLLVKGADSVIEERLAEPKEYSGIKSHVD